MKVPSHRLIDRLAYSRDASIYRLVPSAIHWPKNENDIIQLLSYAKRNQTSLTFRAGGTSLSGQSVTNGIIVDISKYWQKSEVLNKGKSIKLQPGVIGMRANLALKSSCMKIGPDPASINSAMIGGIVNNNASGMACGTANNAYHTLESIRFILANGHVYDSSLKGESQKFMESENYLSQGLLKIRDQIKSNPILVKKIRDKYRIKNTMGYSLNAFLDYDHPFDIFSHLLVGSEGTLAFLSEVTLKTIPDPPEKSTGLFLFESTQEACDLVPRLSEFDFASIEYMDFASLRTVKYLKNKPINPQDLPENAVGLLLEYEDDSKSTLREQTEKALSFIQKQSAYISGRFTEEAILRENLWDLRKGLYPTVGALRNPGTSVITEDIAVDPSNMGEAISGLLTIFKNTDTKDAVTFGHAKDGNIHFVASVDLEHSKSLAQYERLIDDMAELTLGKFNGSLKAEHGTGRNMAPFVEKEWGSELYQIMCDLKSIGDPGNIFNPGVLINSNKKHHISNLKVIPKVNNEIDLCVECGFCERICPSNGLSLSPRQRIILAREMVQLSHKDKQKLKDEIQYALVDTCASDGLCALSCPVNINTGNFVKDLRQLTTERKRDNKESFLVNHFSFLVKSVRFGLKIVNILNAINAKWIESISQFFNRISNQIIPVWTQDISQLCDDDYSTDSSEKADFILFTSCVNRVLSPDGKNTSLARHFLDIGDLSGQKIVVPENINDLCCGMAFHSRGQFQNAKIAMMKTIQTLYPISQKGTIPVIVDMSPCTYHLISEGIKLEGDLGKKWNKITFIDSVQFLSQIISNLTINKLNQKIAIHPTCSNVKMGLSDKMLEIASKCAETVMKAEEDHCCGMAGDRGLRYPELTENATQYEKNRLMDLGKFDTGYSSGRTCEIGMGKSTGKPYFHIALLVKDALQNSIINNK
ncbi:MAG: FAD-binding oxidoreductase [Candidatus Marinimicrobia bacterium]|jgi:D-lactate dehydrogenase|nr:FAD-binding oxidoreductase [Candidatus Neomarinimicrobiota bacterium]MBT6914113.1 FAD-binding oxidoreductase [Candidatus Neomarinimicrobiota bacterium]MBT7184401.1 FAD-binding oxidoreductase [Candidatus Neomarinimicrobiota bacterium]